MCHSAASILYMWQKVISIWPRYSNGWGQKVYGDSLVLIVYIRRQLHVAALSHSVDWCRHNMYALRYILLFLVIVTMAVQAKGMPYVQDGAATSDSMDISGERFNKPTASIDVAKIDGRSDEKIKVVS